MKVTSSLILLFLIGFSIGMNFGGSETANGRGRYYDELLNKIASGKVVEFNNKTYKFKSIEVRTVVEEVK